MCRLPAIGDSGKHMTTPLLGVLELEVSWSQTQLSQFADLICWDFYPLIQCVIVSHAAWLEWNPYLIHRDLVNILVMSKFNILSFSSKFMAWICWTNYAEFFANELLFLAREMILASFCFARPWISETIGISVIPCLCTFSMLCSWGEREDRGIRNSYLAFSFCLS